MAAVVVFLVIFLAMTGHSSAIYCVCKDGLSDSVLQKNIDYACGAGADCSAITQNGACYNPNTVKDHCNYAVNSYYQKKAEATGSCDFAGTANTSPTMTSTAASGCVYPSSSTAGTSTTPSTNGTTPSTTPSTNTTTPSTSTTPTGTTTTSPSVFGLGPTGTTISTNSKASVTLRQNTHLFWSFTLTLLFSGPMILRL